LEAALTENPECELKLVLEPQGEALAVAAGNGAFFTLSEGQQQPLYKYFFIDISAKSDVGSSSSQLKSVSMMTCLSFLILLLVILRG